MPDYPAAIPMLSYENGTAAMDWLISAFGFSERERWLDNGRLSHGELETELGGVIMLASPTPDYESPRTHREKCAQAKKWSAVPWVLNGVLVYVKDVDAHFAKAKAAGARILSEVETGGPGKRYRVEDCEGQRWMFMEKA